MKFFYSPFFRLAGALIVILGVRMSSAQNQLGLSDQQVLKMEVEQWVDHYCAKVNNSLPKTRVEATHIYIRCLRRRNDTTLSANFISSDQQGIKQLRAYLNELRAYASERRAQARTDATTRSLKEVQEAWFIEETIDRIVQKVGPRFSQGASTQTPEKAQKRIQELLSSCYASTKLLGSVKSQDKAKKTVDQLNRLSVKWNYKARILILFTSHDILDTALKLS